MFAIPYDRSCVVSAVIKPVTWIPFHYWVTPGEMILVSSLPELSRTDPGGSQASTRSSADVCSRRLTVWQGSIKLRAVWQRSCQKTLLYLLWLPRTMSGPGSLLSWSCCSGLVLSLFYYIPHLIKCLILNMHSHMCIYICMWRRIHTHTAFQIHIHAFSIYSGYYLHQSWSRNESPKLVLQVGKIWFGSYTKIWYVHYSSHKLIDY